MNQDRNIAKRMVRLTSCSAALLLLSISNILELYIPRSGEGNYIVRLPIQLISGGVLALMWLSLLFKKKHWTKTSKSFFYFILLVLFTGFFYFASEASVDITLISPYIKLLSWMTAVIFFYEEMIKYPLNRTIMKIYILSFIASVFKKIIEASIFQSGSLGGGDTAALPLLFLIPLVLLFFESNLKMILIILIAVLIFFSLRRTAIIGLACCVPYIYKSVKQQLKSYHIVIGLSIVVIVFSYTWTLLGDTVIYRFNELVEGNKMGSYGSGRSDFYVIVWEDFWKKDNIFTVVFGNGLLSVRSLLMRDYGIEHAHNDLLEIGYTFGIVGIFIWGRVLFSLWSFLREIKNNNSNLSNLFKISFISYLVIAFASGCLLRSTTMPFAITVAVLLFFHYRRTNPPLTKVEQSGSATCFTITA